MNDEQLIEELLKQGELTKIYQCLDEMTTITPNMIFLQVFLQIFQREVEENLSVTMFDYSLDLKTLIHHFVKLKLYIRRLEFGYSDAESKEIYEYIINTGVSNYLLMAILQNNIFYRVRTTHELACLFEQMEGITSSRALFFYELSQYYAKETQ